MLNLDASVLRGGARKGASFVAFRHCALSLERVRLRAHRLTWTRSSESRPISMNCRVFQPPGTAPAPRRNASLTTSRTAPSTAAAFMARYGCEQPTRVAERRGSERVPGAGHCDSLPSLPPCGSRGRNQTMRFQ